MKEPFPLQSVPFIQVHCLEDSNCFIKICLQVERLIIGTHYDAQILIITISWLLIIEYFLKVRRIQLIFTEDALKLIES
ncbi:hypothetical protein FGO68_gene8265 [Halteria grandinella]|uniref:Uncharacterized protein n=1 Tax=Halteria grandinella TaxID=5974 RepID=A0A8J8T877_HALGN|nr:hypothetical protein FGO68_gene8265 [Halteria grandinella]